MARKQVKTMSETVVEKPEVEVVEETTTKKETPNIKKRKRLSVDKIVEEAIKINNIPVYDEDAQPVVSKNEKKVPKKPKVSKKQLAYEKRQHELMVEKKILEGDDAAYVQVVTEKKKKRKIIRYNTNVETGLTNEVAEHRKMQNLSNKEIFL